MRFIISQKTIYKWKKRYDGTIKSLEDRNHRPHHLQKSHTDRKVKIIKRPMKKYNWKDVILVYKEMREKYGYTRSYDSFWKFVSRLKVKTIKEKKTKRNPKPYKRV